LADDARPSSHPTGKQICLAQEELTRPVYKRRSVRAAQIEKLPVDETVTAVKHSYL
jgi:hypothetical protein